MDRSKQNTRVDGNKDDGVDDSVDNSDDGGDKHLTHLTKADDCCLMERNGVDNSDDNSDDGGDKCVDDDNGDSVDDSDDSGGKHLTYLSPVVDCHLTEGSDSKVCVDDGKEGVDNSDGNSDDGGDKHLTHLTQVENN
eukprot:12104168-Ditylum_brightwellii.AAC.1